MVLYTFFHPLPPKPFVGDAIVGQGLGWQKGKALVHVPSELHIDVEKPNKNEKGDKQSVT